MELLNTIFSANATEHKRMQIQRKANAMESKRIRTQMQQNANANATEW